MRKLLVLLVLAAPWPALAHPVFSSASVVNAASFLPPELAGGSIARGSIFTVFGSAIGPRTPVSASTIPLANELANVAVVVARPGFPDVAALPLFVSETQINAILPSNAPLGAATIRIRFDDGDGSPFSIPVAIRVVEASFGLFTANASGRGPAAAMNFESQAEQPRNSPLRAARRGQVVTLWGTGLGPLPGAPPGGDAIRPLDAGLADLRETSEVAVWFGGARAANVLYAGRSPEFAGLDQIVVEIPAEAPLGCYVPVWVTVKEGGASNFATLAVGEQPGVCQDPLNPYWAPSGAGRLAAVRVQRTRSEAGAVAATLDTAAAWFLSTAGQEYFYDPDLSLPPLGTCLLSAERNAAGGLRNPPGGPLRQRPAAPLDAGARLTVRGPNGAREMPRTEPGFHEALLEGAGGFLAPGVYSFEGSGGAEVPAFQAQADVPEPPAWTLAGDGATVRRDQPLRATFAGGDPARHVARLVGVVASTANPTTAVTVSFHCTAAIETGAFDVPVDVLRNLPASAGAGAASTAALYLGWSAWPAAARFEAAGLDFAYLDPVVLRGRPIGVR